MSSQTGLCEGCARTLDEISVWADADDAQKRTIWRAIHLRQRLDNPVSTISTVGTR